MLLQVIEFFDEANRTLVQRVPPYGTAEIPIGSQLIVQPGQEAVLLRDGQARDVIGAGRHTLTRKNVPRLVQGVSTRWEDAPLTAQVFFVGLQTFFDQKWAAEGPIEVLDPQHGAVGLSAFGRYSFRVSDAAQLVNSLVAPADLPGTEEVLSELDRRIVERLTELLGVLDLTIDSLPGRLEEISAAARAKITAEFAQYGLKLLDFFINALSPPGEIQQRWDQQAGTTTSSDLRDYTLQQADRALRKLAERGSAGQVAGPPHGLLPPSDPRELIRQVAESAGWQVDSSEDPRWKVIVPLGTLRQQVVQVDFSRKDEKGYALVQFCTTCGAATPQNAMQFLRYNAQLVHGAFAVREGSAGAEVILQANQLADTADALEVMRTVAAIAWQADYVEQTRLAPVGR